jgi:uncharacterized repeat protein (TIGR03803 family)
MKKNFNELAEGWEQAATWRRGMRKLGIGLVSVALVCGRGISAWADWTPPESSVTPPAVVTLDAFEAADVNGSYPSTGLVLGPDGALYGSTPNGGTNGYGTLFRVETNGTFTKLHDFNGIDGSGPSAALVVGQDSALYGSTASGGTSSNGTLFRVEVDGIFTKLHDFNGTNGANPSAALVIGPDGRLYGSTPNGGTNGYGTLFRLGTNGTFVELHDLNFGDGYGVSAALVMGPDGALYGSAPNGGGVGIGTLFRMEKDGTFTKLHDFNGTSGYRPSAALVVGPDGALYGSTQFGSGSNVNYGTLFRLQTNGAFTKIHDFNGADGGELVEALVVGPDGALYGSTPDGGANGYPNGYPDGCGTLFRLETNGILSKLHDFNGTDGRDSSAALVVGSDGAFYGSTYLGGASDEGTLFRLSTNGTFTKLHDFNGTDGYGPSAALVVGADGALYGSTVLGGSGTSFGLGTLFRVEANGTFTKLHDFNHTSDGYEPLAALVMGPDGALYGSTQSGGTNGDGTLFRLDASGMFAKLHDFNGSDGYGPSAALVEGPDGALYGASRLGGTNGGWGTLFRLETNGSFTKLHDFNGSDGNRPAAALVVGPDGALYGSTYATLFRLETNGTFTNLHDFNSGDGYGPSAALVVGPDDALYGSTFYGGTGTSSSGGYGTLFRLETNGTFTKLHDFNGTNGAGPSVALVVGTDGALYGTTLTGATNYNSGTLFRLETNGTFSKLHDFGGFHDAYGWSAALVVGSDGALYGSTEYGGTNGDGALFRVSTNGSYARLHDFNGTDGTYPYYNAALVSGPDGALYGSTPFGGPRRGGILFKVVLNRPPVARCHDVTVSAGVNCAADASVDNGSFDPDAGDTITLRQAPPGPYPLGATPVTLIVTDNHSASNSCTATVTVMDTTPPTIGDVTVTPNVLWPPNGKMVEVSVDYTVSDDCGGVTNVLSVTSNEAANGSAPDWVIEDDHHVQLRAERSGAGSERLYRVTVISTDNSGNSATRTVTVGVPKNQGK